MQKRFAMIFMMICLVSTGFLLFPNTAYAKKITSMRQAKKKALKEIKNTGVIEVDKDYEKGTIIYKIYLMKGTKEYIITYRACDGKKIAYGWKEHSVNKSSTKKRIGKNKCRKQAQKKVKNGRITSLVKRHDRIDFYKVTMKKSNRKYELKFHAGTGELLEYGWELMLQKTKDNSPYIGAEKAKKIALKKVPGADVKIVKFNMHENRVPVYNVELNTSRAEYFIIIHAINGEILMVEKSLKEKIIKY